MKYEEVSWYSERLNRYMKIRIYGHYGPAFIAFPCQDKLSDDFSNNGIKAAAATQVGGLGAANGGFDYFYEIPVEEIDLTFDKPFMYIIRDKATGEVWFAGTVYEGLQRSVAKSSD